MTDELRAPALIWPDYQHKVVSRGDWETDDLVDSIETAVNRINEKQTCLYFVVRYSRRVLWVGGWKRKPAIPDVCDLSSVDLKEIAA